MNLLLLKMILELIFTEKTIILPKVPKVVPKIESTLPKIFPKKKN